MNSLSKAAAILAAVLVYGCGFHLRGSADLPEDVGAIYVQGPTLLADDLALNLQSGGARIASTPEAADTILVVASEAFDRRVLSVDAGTGKVAELELAYTTTFQVTGKERGVLIGEQRVNLLRNFVFDAEAVIGKTREEDVLRREMRRDAAQQIVRRLEAALRK